MTLPQPVAVLINAGRLERVPVDRPSALARLAVTAHMLANGYRVRPIARAHEAVGDYAQALIKGRSASEYQRMRRRRNKSEYEDVTIGRAELTADVAHVEAIIDSVRNSI